MLVTGMGMEMFRDLSHRGVEVPLAPAKSTICGPSKYVVHVSDGLVARCGAVRFPDHHRDQTDLAVRNPTDLIFCVPMGESGCFAQLTVRVKGTVNGFFHRLSFA